MQDLTCLSADDGKFCQRKLKGSLQAAERYGASCQILCLKLLEKARLQAAEKGKGFWICVILESTKLLNLQVAWSAKAAQAALVKLESGKQTSSRVASHTAPFQADYRLCGRGIGAHLLAA